MKLSMKKQEIPPHLLKYFRRSGIKPKDDCLVPERFVIAAQEAGWYVRSRIIWSKPNPMPESVTDRPTDAYEHIFLLTKAKNYWYDAEAVREKLSPETLPRLERGVSENHKNVNGAPGQTAHSMSAPRKHGEGYAAINLSGRNLRNVWTFPTQPYSEAHFATFPEELVRRCLLAGCPEKTCEKCGAGWVRIQELVDAPQPFRSERYVNQGYAPDNSNHKGEVVQGKIKGKTLGWRPSCKCENEGRGKGVALDCFLGSGTVVDVALRSNRIGIGVELSKAYIRLAQKRTEQSRRQGVLI